MARFRTTAAPSGTRVAINPQFKSVLLWCFSDDAKNNEVTLDELMDKIQNEYGRKRWIFAMSP